MALPFATCIYRLEAPEQALGGIPLDIRIVMEDKPSKLSHIFGDIHDNIYSYSKI